MADTTDFLIVGGGIIGCGLAYRLAQAGARVTVCERERIGGHATTASAGMVIPLPEGENEVFTRLALRSGQLWPEWAAAVRERSQLDPGFYRASMLAVGFNAIERRHLEQEASHLSTAGQQVSWLEPQEAQALEPALSPRVEGAYLLEGLAHVHTPFFMGALSQVLAQLGVVLRDFTEAYGFLTDRDRVIGVLTTSGPVHADHVVLATGAWTGTIAARLGLDLPVQPKRGQAVLLDTAELPLRHVIFGAGGYVVPKPYGQVLVGATVEDAGFDRRATVAGATYLTQVVEMLVPGLGSAAFSGMQVGLRPGSPDGLPLLGPVPLRRHLWIASGHFRNGVLLAPVTAELLAEALLQNKLDPLRPLLPKRFLAY
jgi:glycine oxidase